jgi:peptidoglycan LD-endopeptidase LytH
MIKENPLIPLLKKYAPGFFPVVKVGDGDTLLPMDFTDANTALTGEITGNINWFCNYVNAQLKQAGARYGIGGYNEMRALYAHNEHFNTGNEPRRLHLGVDIWGDAGTPVFAFMGGMVHSVAFNSKNGDYGATIILSHQLDGVSFYTLYGHLSLRDIKSLPAGSYVVRGAELAHFGRPAENGNWPPHLHFQIISDIGIWEGDYPGVCSYSERESYLYNCPDPDLILNMNRYIGK